MAGEKQEHRNKKTKQTETDQRGRDRKQQQRSARQRRAARVLLPVRVQTQECFFTPHLHMSLFGSTLYQPVTEAEIVLKTNSYRNDNISVPFHIEACQMSRPDSSHDLFQEENKYTGFNCQWLIQRGYTAAAKLARASSSSLRPPAGPKRQGCVCLF